MMIRLSLHNGHRPINLLGAPEFILGERMAQYETFFRSLAETGSRVLLLARALATDPAVLLLDEPAAGMNPQETLELKSLILHLRKEFDLSILLIEHDMGMVMSLSDRIYVMEYGSRIAMGTPQEVRENPRVIKAYLGESDHA